jgi:hypothetical protein
VLSGFDGRRFVLGWILTLGFPLLFLRWTLQFWKRAIAANNPKLWRPRKLNSRLTLLIGN